MNICHRWKKKSDVKIVVLYELDSRISVCWKFVGIQRRRKNRRKRRSRRKRRRMRKRRRRRKRRRKSGRKFRRSLARRGVRTRHLQAGHQKRVKRVGCQGVGLRWRSAGVREGGRRRWSSSLPLCFFFFTSSTSSCVPVLLFSKKYNFFHIFEITPSEQLAVNTKRLK